jgi:FkbM family methyltransferase
MMSTAEHTQMTPELVGLPETMPLTEHEYGNSRQYGAMSVAAAYCGFKGVPCAIRGNWVHGWDPRYREKLHPDFMFGIRTDPSEHYFVARKDQEDYLRGEGFPNVHAIGMPVVYLGPPQVRRRPGSLLVMPMHSGNFVTVDPCKFDEYAEAIDAIRSDFDEVVICLHPVCWEAGFWVDAFARLGFPIVQGAVNSDRNGLRRVQYLMSRFKFVTTNGFGSHLAYASYFGAKASVYGPFASHPEEAFTSEPLYSPHLKLIKKVLHGISEDELRRNCPWFFCHPRDAKENVEWGEAEVGAANKVSPGKLRSLFGWDRATLIKKSFKASVPVGIKQRVRTYLRPADRETQRLLSMPPNQRTTTDLLGPPLEVPDGSRFIEKKRLIFDQDLYRFPAKGDPPRVLDCGAGIGLNIRYFKQLYPNCRITAFEPAPDTFEILRRNCDFSAFRDVELLRKAVWNCETRLPLARQGLGAGRIATSPVAGQPLEVQTHRLRDCLIEPIDLLLLNIQGAEVEVLLDSSDRLDRVEHLIVEYHSRIGEPQRVDVLIHILAEAGFRMRFRADRHDSSPLHARYIGNGLDTKLQVFGYRP